MGREKDAMYETEDVLLPGLIDAGALGECSMHPGCTYIVSEDLAYAAATNLCKEGVVSMDRSDAMDAVKQILDQTPYTCAGCGG